jgi:S-DNA-T family DNA segregation ATPase FtsK/SpoIIIE
MVRRNNETKDALAAGRVTPSYDQVVYLVPDLPGLFGVLPPEVCDRFTATVEHCDASLAASFVVGGSEPLTSSLLQQPWARTHLTSRDGIWVGDGFSGQFSLQTAKSSDTPYEEIGAGFGYVLTGGKLRLVKLLNGVDEAAE